MFITMRVKIRHKGGREFAAPVTKKKKDQNKSLYPMHIIKKNSHKSIKKTNNPKEKRAKDKTGSLTRQNQNR